MWLSQTTLIVGALAVAGCQPLSQGLLEKVDLRPPTLLSTAATAEAVVSLTFNEWVELDPDHLRIEPELGQVAATPGETVEVVAGPQRPGAPYRLSATARDATGNTTWFVTAFWGHNPRPPTLLINELTTQGSATRPDAVELLAVTAGNLGGITVFDGVPGNFGDRVVMPLIEVLAGQFIVVHATDSGLGEDETTSPDESAHHLAIAGARDLWLESGSGLSGNNGVVTLASHPEGELLDAVLYSNRTSSSDERYRGFGTRTVMKRVDAVVARGQWRTNGDLATPEDAVSSAFITSTRSMGRGADAADTDSAADRHTVPTRGASFGAANSDDRHQPN